MNILFVEDSTVLRRSMVKAAEAAGFKTAEADNGVEALAKLRKPGTTVDLIVMDWNMPVMDGFETLQKIKAQSDYSDIPVLMATADGAQDDVVKAMKAGAAGYLVKPFTADSLLKKVTDLLGKEPAL